jgi:hypothetical protein
MEYSTVYLKKRQKKSHLIIHVIGLILQVFLLESCLQVLNFGPVWRLYALSVVKQAYKQSPKNSSWFERFVNGKKLHRKSRVASQFLFVRYCHRLLKFELDPLLQPLHTENDPLILEMNCFLYRFTTDK